MAEHRFGVASSNLATRHKISLFKEKLNSPMSNLKILSLDPQKLEPRVRAPPASYAVLL